MWQDLSSDNDGFKSRLLARERGCVVCMAANAGFTQYQYEGDSELFNGAHIFPLKYYSVVSQYSLSIIISLIFALFQWDHKQYSSIVADPFTAPGALKSTTSRAGTNERRMNSIDNGLLLCLVHHKEFDTHMFSIHPEVGSSLSLMTYMSNSVSDTHCNLVPSSNQVNQQLEDRAAVGKPMRFQPFSTSASHSSPRTLSSFDSKVDESSFGGV
jgi:hypothetical protein